VSAVEQLEVVGKYWTYPEYKDSGVEWLGVIPAHWEMWKLAHAYDLIGSGTTPPTSEEGWFGEGIPWVTTGELRETLIEATSKYVIPEALNVFSALRVHPAGSLVIAMYGATIGRLGILGVNATTNQACCVLTKSKHLDKKYVFYWLQAFREDIVRLSSGGGQPNINQEKVASLKISAPDAQQQRTIATFLDYETTRIDKLIAQQQRLIELLKEKRQAVISHAVTKGLNPDAPMKDSGVEWLGEVPEHWDLVRAKTVFHDQDDRSISGDEELLTVSHLTGVTLRSEKDVNMFQAESLVGYKICAKEDFVVNTMWAWMGAMGVSSTRGIVSPSYNVYSVNKSRLHASYLELLCRTPEFISVVTSRSKGIWSSRLRIYPESLYEIRLSLPPLNEQRNIVEYVEQQTGTYAYLIDKADSGIRLMQERRTALISAAVTGKIDLRRWTKPDEVTA
jgi:type I restriction enzyme S subunit